MPKITYSDEFKRDAVGLVESGVPQKQVVKDLGIARTTLQAWMRDARCKSHAMTPTTDLEAGKDMSQAPRRIRELEMENEVLWGAAAYLSQAHITPQHDLPAGEADGCGRCPGEGAGRGRVPGLGIVQTGLLQVAKTTRVSP